MDCPIVFDDSVNELRDMKLIMVQSVQFSKAHYV